MDGGMTDGPEFSGFHRGYWMFVYSWPTEGAPWAVFGGKVYEWGKDSDDGPPVVSGEIAIAFPAGWSFKPNIAMGDHEAAPRCGMSEEPATFERHSGELWIEKNLGHGLRSVCLSEVDVKRLLAFLTAETSMDGHEAALIGAA